MFYRKWSLLLLGLLFFGTGCVSSGLVIYDSQFKLPNGYSKKHKLVGEKVIFLPKYYPSYGYQSYYSDEKTPWRNHPTYNNLVSKEAEIIGYKVGRFSHAVLKVDDINWVLYTHATLGTLDDVGFVSEMKNAQQYIGKSVWNKAHLTEIDADFYDRIRCSRKIGTFEKVTIVDINWSKSSDAPLKFIFETEDGLRGSWRGVFSLINSYKDDYGVLFSENWYFEDPHIIHSDWPQNVWDSIEKKKIFVGMTKEQAILSWGKPRKISKDVGSWGVNEQWIYGSHYLFFKNDKLTSFHSS